MHTNYVLIWNGKVLANPSCKFEFLPVVEYTAFLLDTLADYGLPRKSVKATVSIEPNEPSRIPRTFCYCVGEYILLLLCVRTVGPFSENKIIRYYLFGGKKVKIETRNTFIINQE